MNAIALLLLLLVALPSMVEGVPIDLSASLGGLSIDGSTEDTVLAADCLPGKACPTPGVKREIELTLPKEPALPPAEKAKIIVIPALPPELKEPIDKIKQEHSAKESELLFELLKDELLKGDLDDFLKEFEKTHLEIGVKEPPGGGLDDYSAVLKELIDGGFLYEGIAKFIPGVNPLGAALIIVDPETGEGVAAVTLFAVPYPATWLLVAVGSAGVLRRRRAKAA